MATIDTLMKAFESAKKKTREVMSAKTTIRIESITRHLQKKSLYLTSRGEIAIQKENNFQYVPTNTALDVQALYQLFDYDTQRTKSEAVQRLTRKIYAGLEKYYKKEKIES